MKLAVTFQGQPEIDSNQGSHTLWINLVDEDGYQAGSEKDAVELTQAEIDRVLGWLREDAATDEYPFLKAEIVNN
jgi:hypothetical protein